MLENLEGELDIGIIFSIKVLSASHPHSPNPSLSPREGL
jgi:hypothetical protein